MGFLRYGTLCDICYAKFWNWKHLSDEWVPILKLEREGTEQSIVNTVLAVIVDVPIL